MDFVNPILEILIRLWDCVTRDLKSIRDFEASLKALEDALDQLKNASDDLNRRVQVEEERQMLRTKQVDSWLRKVEVTEKEARAVLEKAGRRPRTQTSSCFGCCPNNCWSSYKIVDKVEKELKALKSQGHFDAVADVLPRGVVDERPLGDTVGLRFAFQELQRWIGDSQVNVVGVYGMGGVGKTTLLKKVNNEFVSTDYGFELVIWVVVSKQSDVETVQESICEKLNLPEGVWKNKTEDEKAVHIFRFLRLKKFVLLLDDVWRRLDLVKVGVPTSSDPRTCKVIFTTRYEDVCGSMDADRKIKIECLARDEALTLFGKKVGTSTLNAHPSLRKLSEIVAEECKGLPLALITVGRAMAHKTDPRDWDRAITRLRKEPSRIMGMDDEVFRVLKFSYDSLKDDLFKSCFVHCCIYPEDYDILIEDLLELWIGEGLLDEYSDIHEARDRGREVVGCLKDASLLESGKSEDYVKMHDVIRDMALWVFSGSKPKRTAYLVLNHRVGLLEVDLVTSSTITERISLWGSSIDSHSITEIPTCPHVLTFLARHTAIRMFPSGFLQFMPVIRVLDLSFNFYLVELPSGIGQLVELEFLNLSNTRIKELPVELKNLTKMKYLLLNATYRLHVIPTRLILSFSLLRVFKISGSSDSNPVENNVLSGGRMYLLEELESLQHINEISITISDAISVGKLLSSRRILSCLSSLCFEGLASLELPSSSIERMRHLERLDLYYSKLNQLTITGLDHNHPGPGGYFLNLRSLYISYCDNLLDLTWLVYAAPTLELLDIAHCASMVEIVKDVSDHVAGAEQGLSVFPRLKTLRLINVPRLRSIHSNPLPFPSLVEIHVSSCHRLRRLPFDSSSGNSTLKEIRGALWWWVMLEWEDASIEQLFRSYYVAEGTIW